MRPVPLAMILIRLITFCFVLSWVSMSIGCREYTEDSSEFAAEAKKFKAELLTAISGTHRIEIVEHSWHSDFFDEKGDMAEDLPLVEYKRMELTPELRTKLQLAFERMPETPKNEFSFCGFQPHHTIELIDGNGSKSFIQVCFACDDTKWNGTSGLAPRDFQKVLRGFIEEQGFQSERDWEKLAKDQAQQAGTGQPATSPESESDSSDKPQPEAEGRSR